MYVHSYFVTIWFPRPSTHVFFVIWWFPPHSDEADQTLTGHHSACAGGEMGHVRYAWNHRTHPHPHHTHTHTHTTHTHARFRQVPGDTVYIWPSNSCGHAQLLHRRGVSTATKLWVRTNQPPELWYSYPLPHRMIFLGETFSGFVTAHNDSQELVKEVVLRVGPL